MEVSVFNFNFFLFCSFFKLQNIFLLFSTLQMFTFTTLFPPWSTLWKLVLRRLQDVFIKKNVCWFRFVTYKYPHFYVSKTSRRCLQDMSSGRLQDMSSGRLQDICNNFSSSKTFSRRLAKCLQDAFKTSLQHVFNTSWETKNCYTENLLMMSSRHFLKVFSRRLQDQQLFTGIEFTLEKENDK